MAMAQTAAGTRITNVASASFLLDGQAVTLTSNMVTTCVAERLDVVLQTHASASGKAVAFTLKNAGNGPEAFALGTTVDGKSAALPIMIDADGDHAFDPAIDTVAIAGGVTPIVPANEELNLLVVTDQKTPADAKTLTLSAHANTGTGAVGSSFAGQGEGACDAVVGASASASLSSSIATTASAAAKIVKSQQVLAADGSATPTSGAIITYRLEVVTASGGPLNGAFITDPLPNGTDYLPGSLQLDGAVLSDGDDGDAGAFDGQQIRVALGNVPQATSKVVTFQVKIQ